MKLINKISRYFLFSSIMIFIVVSAALYFVINKAIISEVDEQLVKIKDRAIQELHEGKAVSFPPFIEINPTYQYTAGNEFKYVSVKTKEDNEDEPFRQLTSYANVNGKNFSVTVRISLIEKEELLFSLTATIIIGVLIFTIVMFFLNKAGSKRILKGFYDTLTKLEKFSLKDAEAVSFERTDIEEFENLNKSLLYLAEKARGEYRSLKEFTEELNHEMQTPVAVIKSKMELLLQSSNLNEENLTTLDTSLKQLYKLERINKAILLLNKLEHKDLFESKSVNIAEEVKNIIALSEDFIAAQSLTVNLSLQKQITFNMNASLLNILLGNLISNAIKHSTPGGLINIVGTENRLTISNTALEPRNAPENFFNRFYKESNLTESVGLGLTIAKKICDLYGIEISNQFSNGMYIATLEFNRSIINDKL